MHVDDNRLNHEKRRRELQLITFSKGNPPRDAVLYSMKGFAGIEGAVADVWQNYIPTCKILPNYR